MNNLQRWIEEKSNKKQYERVGEWVSEWVSDAFPHQGILALRSPPNQMQSGQDGSTVTVVRRRKNRIKSCIDKCEKFFF